VWLVYTSALGSDSRGGGVAKRGDTGFRLGGGMPRLARRPWTPWWRAFSEFLVALERVTARGPFPARLAGALAWTLAAWWIYVPLHELLHALGCAVTGGTVGRLWIQPLYGGRFLARLFPFVTAGGSYAGRLEGFDTGGSDIGYLSTVLLPFLLTVAGAFPLLRMAARRRSPAALGAGLVLAAALFISLPGDLYEGGSILVSSALAVLFPSGLQPSPAALRHEDLWVLLGDFNARFPAWQPFWAGGILLSFLAGGLLGGGILALSERLASRLGLSPSAPALQVKAPSRSGLQN